MSAARNLLSGLWSRHKLFLVVGAIAVGMLWIIPAIAAAAAGPTAPTIPIPSINIGVGGVKNPKDVASSLQSLN